MRRLGQFENFIFILLSLKNAKKGRKAKRELCLIRLVSRWEMLTFLTGTYISSGFQESSGTRHVISKAGFVQWGNMVYGDCIYIITLNMTRIILKMTKKFHKIISTTVIREWYKRWRNLRQLRKGQLERHRVNQLSGLLSPVIGTSSHLNTKLP